MKVVVIIDVHANLPALEATMGRIREEGYDLLVHTGDAIAIGLQVSRPPAANASHNRFQPFGQDPSAADLESLFANHQGFLAFFGHDQNFYPLTGFHLPQCTG